MCALGMLSPQHTTREPEPSTELSGAQEQELQVSETVFPGSRELLVFPMQACLREIPEQGGEQEATGTQRPADLWSPLPRTVSPVALAGSESRNSGWRCATSSFPQSEERAVRGCKDRDVASDASAAAGETPSHELQSQGPPSRGQRGEG